MEIDKYGRMAKNYLENNNPDWYLEMKESGELDQYLQDKMREVHESLEIVIRQIQEKKPEMTIQNVQALAEELVLNDIFPQREQN